MPGIDFAAVQAEVPMLEVLRWIGFVPVARRGDQLRGPCPIHRSRSARSRVFSVNVLENVCYCHRCHFGGNQIQLWAILHGLTRHHAALDLCHHRGIAVPWLHRW